MAAAWFGCQKTVINQEAYKEEVLLYMPLDSTRLWHLIWQWLVRAPATLGSDQLLIQLYWYWRVFPF